MKTLTPIGTRLRPVQPQAHQLLNRILAEPELVAMVQALPPRALGKLIQHVGLEDSGELVALATTEQLQKIFDDDLWRSAKPGQDERFDPARFALWLEVMLEAGESFVAEKLTELPEELVIMALDQQVLVLNRDELALSWIDDDRDFEMTEKALDSCLYHDIGEFQVISKRHDGWDAIVAVLTTLDQNHHDFLQRVLERCCAATTEYIDDNGGLYQVLTSEEMLQSDAAAEREERRGREGFIAPSSAVAFLKLASQGEVADIVVSERDPITRGYFRDLAAAPSGAAEETGAPAAKLLDLLQRAEVIEEPQVPRLLEHADADHPSAALFRQAMIDLRELDATAFTQRLAELAYLANILIAGESFEGRAFRPFEAAEAALAVCNRGLEHLLEAGIADQRQGAVELLHQHGADKLFRIGWRLRPTPRKR